MLLHDFSESTTRAIASQSFIAWYLSNNSVVASFFYFLLLNAKKLILCALVEVRVSVCVCISCHNTSTHWYSCYIRFWYKTRESISCYNQYYLKVFDVCTSINEKKKNNIGIIARTSTSISSISGIRHKTNKIAYNDRDIESRWESQRKKTNKNTIETLWDELKIDILLCLLPARMELELRRLQNAKCVFVC